jgi:hypothetical protein
VVLRDRGRFGPASAELGADLVVGFGQCPLDEPDEHVLDDVPEPVHGTYWIESVAPAASHSCRPIQMQPTWTFARGR